MRSAPRKSLRDRVAIEPLAADHDETAGARFIRLPGAVVMMLEAGADALNEQAHGLARDLHEAFHAQHLMRRRDLRQMRDQTFRIDGRREIDDEALEVVVIVIVLGVVTRGAIDEIGLDRRADAERDARIDDALTRAKNAGAPAPERKISITRASSSGSSRSVLFNTTMSAQAI